ncbi:hypothetical protein Tco_1040492, partial [Tanacetum coccineum]
PSERPSEGQPTPSPAHTREVSPVPQTDSSPAHTSEVPIEPQIDSSPAHTSKVPIEPQTDPSPRPSLSTIIPDSIPESSGGNLRSHSSSDKSLSGNEGEMTLQIQVAFLLIMFLLVMFSFLLTEIESVDYVSAGHVLVSADRDCASLN